MTTLRNYSGSRALWGTLRPNEVTRKPRPSAYAHRRSNSSLTRFLYGKHLTSTSSGLLKDVSPHLEFANADCEFQIAISKSQNPRRPMAPGGSKTFSRLGNSYKALANRERRSVVF